MSLQATTRADFADPLALFEEHASYLPISEQALLISEWIVHITHGHLTGHWGEDPMEELRHVERIVFMMVVKAAEQGFVIRSYPCVNIDPQGFVAVFVEFFRKVGPFMVDLDTYAEMAKARTFGVN